MTFCHKGTKSQGIKIFHQILENDSLMDFYEEDFEPLDFETEKIAKSIFNAALKVHQALGPGLLEKIYESCLEYEIRKLGLNIRRQVEIPIVYDNLVFDEGLRLDLLVNNKVIIEIKAVNQVNPVWQAQILSQLKLTKLRLGFVINFNVPIIKRGFRRYIN